MPKRGSPKFLAQLAQNLVSPLPLAVGRFATAEMRSQVTDLIAKHHFDSVVCDFLAPSSNVPDLARCVLFQHNVETAIWRRHAEHGATPLHRAYFSVQADRMEACERHACRTAAHVIAVSDADADQMKQRFGVERISAVATGVDLNYFARPARQANPNGLVFVGAMDWLPNIDGARWFTQKVLPLIRQKRPATALVLAGRSPAAELLAYPAADPLITVTGTVPDVRPYLWNAAVSIVPLRIGGGTRLKIYEAMAAGVPVVSTAVGAEGLAITDEQDIAIADSPELFAQRCLEMLDNPARASSFSEAALHLVRSRFSWEQIGRDFEGILESARRS